MSKPPPRSKKHRRREIRKSKNKVKEERTSSTLHPPAQEASTELVMQRSRPPGSFGGASGLSGDNWGHQLPGSDAVNGGVILPGPDRSGTVMDLGLPPGRGHGQTYDAAVKNRYPLRSKQKRDSTATDGYTITPAQTRPAGSVNPPSSISGLSLLAGHAWPGIINGGMGARGTAPPAAEPYDMSTFFWPNQALASQSLAAWYYYQSAMAMGAGPLPFPAGPIDPPRYGPWADSFPRHTTTSIPAPAPPPLQQPIPRRSKTQPAAAVSHPAPTQTYLAQAFLSPHRTPQPRPLLLIIDLNGTLLHRPSRKAPSKFVRRLDLDSFIAYLLSSFRTMVWSSARPENVRLMCDQLFAPNQRRLLVAQWGRDRLGLNAEQYVSKVQVYKRLESVWGDPVVAAAYPADSGDGAGAHGRGMGHGRGPGGSKRRGSGREQSPWDQSNTVLLDDTIVKASAQPFNCLEVPEFTGSDETEVRLLRRVANYLEELRWWNDVSAFMRLYPFRADDPRWDSVKTEDGDRVARWFD